MSLYTQIFIQTNDALNDLVLRLNASLDPIYKFNLLENKINANYFATPPGALICINSTHTFAGNYEHRIFQKYKYYFQVESTYPVGAYRTIILGGITYRFYNQLITNTDCPLLMLCNLEYLMEARPPITNRVDHITTDESIQEYLNTFNADGKIIYNTLSRFNWSEMEVADYLIKKDNAKISIVNESSHLKTYSVFVNDHPEEFRKVLGPNATSTEVICIVLESLSKDKDVIILIDARQSGLTEQEAIISIERLNKICSTYSFYDNLIAKTSYKVLLLLNMRLNPPFPIPI